MRKLFIAIAGAALIAGTIVVAQQQPVQQSADKEPAPECADTAAGKSCCMPSKASAVRAAAAKPADKH